MVDKVRSRHTHLVKLQMFDLVFIEANDDLIYLILR
jgi:hypothetical protein